MAMTPAGSSAANAPRAEGGALARTDARLARVEDALNLVAALAIFAIMVLGIAQIASRGLSGLLNGLIPAIPRFAIHGYIDYIQFFAAFYGLLGLAYCQRTGGHIRMEIVLTSLRGRLMWALEALATLFAVAAALLLLIGTWDNFYNAWAKGDSSMDIRLPLWPVKLLVPLMLALLLLRLAVQLWGHLRLLRDPALAPLAVPVAETPEEAARREIQEAERLTADAAPHGGRA